MNRRWLILAMAISTTLVAEPRALPPVDDYSTYPKTASSKPSANTSLYETLGRLEQLQVEMQQLRGEVEEQGNTILELKTRLKNIYADFDQRLEKLEGGAGNRPPVPAASSSAKPVIQPSPVITVKPPAALGSEKQQYQKAYETLRNGHYSQAIKLFKQLLIDYPGGQYSANVQYWLGEAYKVNKDINAARKAFNKVISAYPDSPKVADAMLKLGYLELEQNNPAKARDLLTGVTLRYPGTTAAHLAANKLKQLQ